jgi:hypothetical protein
MDCHKPQKVNHVKHILILLSLIFLTFPLVAQESGDLYFKKVNGKFGWFENANDKINWTYVGKIKNVKPFEASLLYKHCSKVIKYPINWNDLKVDWKLVIR